MRRFQQKGWRKSRIRWKQESMMSWKSVVKVFIGGGSDYLCQKPWRGQIREYRGQKEKNMLQSYLILLWSLCELREKDENIKKNVKQWQIFAGFCTRMHILMANCLAFLSTCRLVYLVSCLSLNHLLLE